MVYCSLQPLPPFTQERFGVFKKLDNYHTNIVIIYPPPLEIEEGYTKINTMEWNRFWIKIPGPYFKCYKVSEIRAHKATKINKVNSTFKFTVKWEYKTEHN